VLYPRHPGSDAAALRVGAVQAELAAAPQHVVGGGRPLFVAQAVQFGLGPRQVTRDADTVDASANYQYVEYL